MTTAPNGTKQQAGRSGPQRDGTPHIWEGCDFFAWFRLLVRNLFAVHLSCLHVAVIVSFVSLFNTFLRLVQAAVYGNRVRRTEIREAPLFIIGHWRTGTTLLHE